VRSPKASHSQALESKPVAKTPDPKLAKTELQPPPRIRFALRLKRGQKLESVRECVEISLGTKLSEFFPELLQFRQSIWEYVPSKDRSALKRHLLDAAGVAQRKRALVAGRSAGLPFRLEEAFADAAKKPPAIAKEIVEQRFAILTLPIDWRSFRRKSCKPAGRLYDFAFQLRKACGVASVTPALSHPIGLMIGTLFPPRAEPSQTGTPNVANWHLFNIGAMDAAGTITLPAGANGAGVTVGHPDTGWTAHPELNFVGAASPNYIPGFEADVLTGSASAREPVPFAAFPPGNPLTHPFHGTRSASLIVSTPDAVVSGLAPAATMFPVRCTPDVVLFPPGIDDILVADAIVRSVLAGAQVISISLGGYATEILRWAVQYAVARNVIVVAAAGNYWPCVVYPAGYPECIAVGGSTADDGVWQYSARNWLGPQIDISAPSEFVRNATWNGTTAVQRNNSGTTFGTALVAAAAALWLQRFGRATLIATLAGRVPLQAMFKEHLRATARVPPGWNTFLDGPGILNLAGLLNPATLPNPNTVPPPLWFLNLLSGLASDGNLLLRDLFGVDLAGELPKWFRAVFGEGAAEAATEHAAEVIQLLLGNPLAAEAIAAVEQATQTAEEAAATAEEAAGEAAETAQNAAEQAAQTAQEVTEAAVDTVSEGASDAVSTVASWF
jgi:hypothetical protein